MLQRKDIVRISRMYPDMERRSGIYIFHMIDENGFKKCYVGQAKNLLIRVAQHLSEYDHIALSLKKHGFLKEGKLNAWDITYYYCDEAELDERERYEIKHWHVDLGYIPYNKTGGGQGEGKFNINENEPSKGYYDGLRQGRKNMAREIKHIVDLHLNISVKKEGNKVQEKALSKFYTLLEESDK